MAATVTNMAATVTNMAATTTRLAVVRGLAASLPAEALRQDADVSPVDLSRATLQHAAYVEKLRGLVPRVIEVDADDSLPDCVFVEDTAVCLDGVAMMTVTGHPSRRREGKAIAEVLESAGVRVVHMDALVAGGGDSEAGGCDATLDGGDVLWTGHEFFVGMTARTNAGGLRALQTAFPGRRAVPVHRIPALHLKSLCSMAAPGVVAVGETEGGRVIQDAIEAASPGRYRFVKVPTDADANCVFVNGTLLHIPGARTAFAALGLPLAELDNSELAKVDGALTCCSLLL